MTNNKQRNIPDGWQRVKLGDIGKVSMCKRIMKNQTSSSGDIPFFKIGTFGKKPDAFISHELFNQYKEKYSFPKKGEILISASGTIGRAVVYDDNPAYFQDSNIVWLSNDEKIIKNKFLNYLYKIIKWETSSGTIARLYNDNIKSIVVCAPPLPEQNAIVEILETWDKYLENLDQKIKTKKKIKKGLMQKLLSGDKRLKGFGGEWSEFKLDDISECLDTKRVPLNSEDRKNIKGDYPYCGANGIVDYINKYIFDEDIILIAEDGGYFDEYKTRPIAYRIKEKCWVNNHAHVIKAKKYFSHDLLFYLLVHKNILPYLSGGTRVKLNKSELLKIKINAPKELKEQQAIAEVLTKADEEIEKLEEKRKVIADQKKYLLNNLITRKIRIPVNN